jgi:hypothetical protein
LLNDTRRFQELVEHGTEREYSGIIVGFSVTQKNRRLDLAGGQQIRGNECPNTPTR